MRLSQSNQACPAVLSAAAHSSQALPPRLLTAAPEDSGGLADLPSLQLLNNLLQSLVASLLRLIGSLASVLSTPAPARPSGTEAVASAPSSSRQLAPQQDIKDLAAVSRKDENRQGPESVRLNQHFLWKPVSEADGKLVVLCPAGLSGKVVSVEILSPDEKNVLEKGRYTGTGNGGREHYRFKTPGRRFPSGSLVRISTENGSATLIKIKRPGRRLQKTDIKL